jgi:hypothetical protein
MSKSLADLRRRLDEAADPMVAAAEDWLLAMARAPEGRSVTSQDRQPPERRDWSVEAAVRYWGDWVVPDGEEDDGDYDWKVMTARSADRAKAVLDQVRRQHPSVDMTVSSEEKEWLCLKVSAKKETK